MKILLWDIETSPIIAAVWGLYDQNIPYQHVIQDWHVLCAAWKWLGEDEIHSIACNGKNDKPVIKKLHGLISSADAIIAHNGDNFDWKKFMARVIHHDMPSPPKPILIDTLKQARKFGFTSRKLDDLGACLDIGRKQHVDRGIWVRAAEGDKIAISQLETYCKGDIPPLEGLYTKLRPYVETSLNMARYSNSACCPKCGSKDFSKRGTRGTTTGLYQRFQCGSCYGWFSSTHRDRGVSVR